MARNTSKPDTILQEWTPMSDLLNKIPSKTQIGIFNHDVNLTCVDVLPEFIALGSNSGIVYWYDRKKNDMQRLRCENPSAKITTIKIISTVDYMVACGNCEGQISIFQIPKCHPDTLPESLKPKMKQVERYTVSELHASAITSLEWSKNGMKLFSGDKKGLVVLTEIDFYMHLSKSVDILNEAYELVQLSYCQQHLLVSTTYRTIVCQKQDKWKVCQVGKKDRKSLGNYGGIFLRNGLKPTDVLIYSTRPGLRIWVSDLTGTVLQTLLFKDLLNKECFEVPLINPITGYAKKLKPQKEAMFGILLPFSENLLVTYSSEIIYILDPNNLLIIATISHLRRILSVATYKDELFILEGERSLIRISFKPEPVFNDNPNNVIPTASTFLPLANSIKDLTNKLQTSSIISALPPLFETNTNLDYNVQTDVTSVISAEEACENSPIKKYSGVNFNIPDSKTSILNEDYLNVHSSQECIDVRKEHAKKLEVFEKVASEEFDDHILFKHRRRKKSSNLIKSELNKSATSLSSTSSEEKDSLVNRPCMLNISTVGTIVPDLRSPDSIMVDIENKEKILADMLNLDKIKININEIDNKPNQKVGNVKENTTYVINELKKEQNNDIERTERKRKENFLPDETNFKEPNIMNTAQTSKATKVISEQKKYPPFTIPNDSVEIDSVDASKYFQLPSMNGHKSNENQRKDISETVNSNSTTQITPSLVDMPACLTIPIVWRLQELTILEDGNETSDSSLCDWEII